MSRAQLDPHYDRVEAMLDAQRLSLRARALLGDPQDPRLSRRRRASSAWTGSCRSWRSPSPRRPGRAPVPGEPIVEPLPNLHGRTRQTCRLVGECDLGCNYGAKNTLDYNYLTAAWRAGAEIRTRSRGPILRAARRRWLRDPLRRARPRARGRVDRHQRAAAAERERRSAGALGRDARHDLPPAEEPGRLPGRSAPAWALASRATAICSPSPFDAPRSGRTATACRGGSRRATDR